MARPNQSETILRCSQLSQSSPNTQGTRSIDMNQSANAIGAIRNGKRQKRSATRPAAIVASSIGSQLALIQT